MSDRRIYPRIEREDLQVGDLVKLSPKGETWAVRGTVGTTGPRHLRGPAGGFRYLRKNMKLFLVERAKDNNDV